MKKYLLSFLFYSIFLGIYAGGWNSNTNISGSFCRNAAKSATLETDASFFCPAAITFMPEGLHLSVSSTTLIARQDVRNSYPYMNVHQFKGKISAPIFPIIMLAYNKNRWGISGIVYPYGAGGGGKYSSGLPSFEIAISNVVPEMQNALNMLDIAKPFLGYKASNISDYKADISFYGADIKMGAGIDISYKLTDWLSISYGFKLVYGFGWIDGGLKNLEVNTPKGWMKPGDYLRAINDDLGFLGLAASNFGIADLVEEARKLDSITSDKIVDVSQSGFSALPLCLSISVKPNDKLNFGFKYQMGGKFEYTNDTRMDNTGSYLDGAKVRSDIPGYIALGVQYKFTNKLSAFLSIENYFERQSNFQLVAPVFENDTIIYKVVDNSYALSANPIYVALALEYWISPKLMVGGTYVYAKLSPVKNVGTTERNPIADSHSAGVGIRYYFKHFSVDLGVFTNQQNYVSRDYKIAAPKGYKDENGSEQKYINVKEELYGYLWMFGIGIDYHFKNKSTK